MINLIMGFIWAALGLGLLLYEPVTGRQGYVLKIGDSGINAGWLALFLAGWNGIRTWSSYSYQKFQNLSKIALAQREKAHRGENHLDDPGIQFQDFPNKPLQ